MELGKINSIFFEQFPFPIMWMDLEGTILNSNFATEKLSGYGKTDLIGRKFTEIIVNPQESLSSFEKINGILSKGDSLEPLEIQLYKKDGDLIWLNIQGALVQLGDKNFIQLIMQDNTDQKKKEGRLKESEEKYRLIAENANDLIAIVNRHFEFEYINEPLFFRVLGYEKGDLIGKTGLDLIHPDDLKLALNTIEKGKDNREGIAQLRLKHKNGEYRRFELKGRAFEGKDGKTKAIIIARDTTERWKLTEEIENQNKKLKESEEKYRLITENANDMIAILDENFNFEYINERTYQKILGYTKQDLIGQSSLKLLHPDDLEVLAKKIKGADMVEEGTIEVRNKRKDSTYIWVEVKGQRFTDKDSQRKALVITREITARKKSEEELKNALEKIQKQNEELKELDSLKDEFYADITHELRTPLTAIRGFTDLLLNSTTLDNGPKEDLQVILKNELRLEYLIDELLNYSRLKSGKIQYKRSHSAYQEL